MASNSGDPTDKIFVFVQGVNSFFVDLRQRCDWKISVLPCDKLAEEVDKVYSDCGGILSKPPNIPTDAEKKAMTDVLQWGKELVSDSKYQLEAFFDPQYHDSNFISCFNKKISAWVKDQNNSQQSRATDGIIGLAIFVGVTLILFATAFFIYKRWKKSSTFRPEESGAGLFDSQQSERMKLLADDNDANFSGGGVSRSQGMDPIYNL